MVAYVGQGSIFRLAATDVDSAVATATLLSLPEHGSLTFVRGASNGNTGSDSNGATDGNHAAAATLGSRAVVVGRAFAFDAELRYLFNADRTARGHYNSQALAHGEPRPDSFLFTVCDAGGACVAAPATASVLVSDNLQAAAGSSVVREDVVSELQTLRCSMGGVTLEALQCAR